MEVYPLAAVTTRTVTDTVLLKVKAESLEEARNKAMAALRFYPDGHDEDGIDYCYINNRENGQAEVHSLELDLGEFDFAG